MKLAAWLSICALALCASCSDTPMAKRPNVVLVVIDTLRPDHLAAWGYARDTAPFLTRIAGESAVFENAFSTSTWTAPATASLFTSLYPPQHGVTHGFFVHRAKLAAAGKLDGSRLTLARMPAERPTLPEVFQRAGYDTFGLAANVNIGDEIGFTRGFDRFERLYGADDPKGVNAEQLVARLDAWRAQLADAKPDFVYLHFNDVHEPYERTSPHYERRDDPLDDARAAYDAEIRAVDDALARAYREHDWDRDTVFIVVSDHGEEFGEHGGTGHGFSVYGELARIALLVRAPGVAPRRIDANVSILDVLPTLCELSDVAAPKGVEGGSLAAVMRGEGSAPERDLFVHRSNRELRKNTAAREREATGELWAVIAGGRKLVQRGEAFELYDVANDPHDSRDLAAAEPEGVAELRAKLDAFRARAKPLGGGEVEVELDAGDAEALRKLGYIGDDH